MNRADSFATARSAHSTMPSPEPRRGAVDRGEHRLGQADEPFEQAVPPPGHHPEVVNHRAHVVGRGHLAQVEAAAELLAGAGEDDRAHLVADLGLGQGVDRLLDPGEVERVAEPGQVEGDPGDTVDDVELDATVGASRRRSWPRSSHGVAGARSDRASLPYNPRGRRPENLRPWRTSPSSPVDRASSATWPWPAPAWWRRPCAAAAIASSWSTPRAGRSPRRRRALARPRAGRRAADRRGDRRASASASSASASSLSTQSRSADLLFLVLHGRQGEGGRVQSMLELADLRYVGSDSVGSLLAMDKDVAKRLMTHAGVPTPDWRMWPASRAEIEALGLPLIVKPSREGSTVGTHRAARPRRARGRDRSRSALR